MAINIDYSSLSIVPVDVLPNIFNKLSSELDTVALVCKTWKEVVDSKTFREMIHPPRVMGIKQLMMHNPNILFEGKEHLLPRRFYGEYAIKGGLCFFNPGKVKLKKADGEYKIVVLNRLEAIGSLFPKARFVSTYPPASNVTRQEEDPHWVWEEAKSRGFGKTYNEQLEMAQEEDKANYPERYKAIEETSDVPKSSSVVLGSLKPTADLSKQQISKPKQIVIMSNGDDHILGKFMAEAILGEREVTWDLSNQKHERVRVNKAKVKSTTRDLPISVAFTPSLLEVRPCTESNDDHAGFVCARRSFGT